jgi:hypothetical protein
MNEYELLLVYAIFYFGIFAFGMIWRFKRDRLKRLFHLGGHSTDPSGEDL